MSNDAQLNSQFDSLKNFVERMPYAVQIFSREGLLLYANPAWEDLWQTSAEPIIGKFNAFETDLFKSMGLQEQMLKTREGLTITFPDFELDPKDFGGLGHKLWIRSQAFGLNNHANEVSFIVVFNFDVTDQIEVQERFEENIQKLTETQNQLILQERLGAIGQLASGIAHDFNNILAIILLESQLLQAKLTVGEESLKRLNTIIKQSQKGAHLIRQILDFTRTSLSQKAPLNINLWLEEFIELARRTLPRSIEIKSDILDYPQFIQADPTQLQQIFLNLMVNARDAIDGNGFIYFELDYISEIVEKYSNMSHQAESNEGYAVISVKDSGAGISEEHLERIFEPFFTTKPAGAGSGLGLSQAYGIVKQHFGFIDCQSELGIGTTFLLYFPTIIHFDGESSEEGANIPESNNQGVILLVDDHPLTRRSVSDALEMLQYEVLTAVNGEDALSILEAHPNLVDLVLTDVVMPKMGGLLLRHELQKKYPDIKIVLMTGFTSNEEGGVKEMMQSSSWLMKPFSIDTLEALLQKELQRK